jgi:outer membrane biosynthesis protein TonB
MQLGAPRVQDEQDGALMVGGAIVTLVVHVGLVVAVVLGTLHGDEKMEEELSTKIIEFEEVELLALGVEKAPGKLPDIVNPPLPDQLPDEVAIEPDPTAVAIPKDPKDKKPPKPVEEDKPPEMDERKRKMLEALSDLHDPSRPTTDALPEGSEEGVKGGTLSDAAMANLMGTYQAKLLIELTRNWVVPATLSEAEVKQLSGEAVVYVRLSPEGYIVSYVWKKRSSNDQFDDSIERLLKRYQVSTGGQKLPLPDNEEVRDAVLKQGLNLKSWEYTGR